MEKLPFGPKFKALGEGCLKNWKSADKYKKKNFKYLVFCDNTHHQFKYLFGICLSVLYVDFSVNCLEFAQKGHFPIFSLFWWPFVLAHLSQRLKVRYSDWSSCIVRPFVGNLFL